MPVAFGAGGPGRTRRVLCYGDSLTVGYCRGGYRFEPYARALAEQLQAHTACEVVVCGHNGGTAEEMVASAEGSLVDVAGLRGKGLARALREDGPFDLVLIMAGTNDMGHGLRLDAIVEDIWRLHALCHAQGIPTVALAPPPVPSANTLREGMRLWVLHQLRTRSEWAPGVAACEDPAELVPPSQARLWDCDGLHFSPAGSRMLGCGLAALAVEQGLLSGGPAKRLASPSAAPASWRQWAVSV